MSQTLEVIAIFELFLSRHNHKLYTGPALSERKKVGTEILVWIVVPVVAGQSKILDIEVAHYF